MALLNTDTYGKLAGVSSGTQGRKPGKFFSVFITGEPREGQDMGKLQVMKSIDSGVYLINNEEEIPFIPYFIKRYWEKFVASAGQNNESYDKLVGFGWDSKKSDDAAKYCYSVAGVALGKDMKALTHKEDYDDAGIKAGDPILVHFKCGGIRFNGAMNFLNEIDKHASKLAPLSDSPEFEKSTVYPRRFVCKASVTIASSNYGNKNVFKFDISKGLPDKAVQQVMDSSMSFYDDFIKQFNKESSLVAQVTESNSAGTTETFSDNENTKSDTGDASSTEEPFDDNGFDLGI